MQFRKYQHIENDLNNRDCSGILKGTITIQPKLDGSNCQMWLEDGKLTISSRNKVLSETEDNHNCYKSLINDIRYHKFFNDHPHIKLIGEWLVPHTVKYISEACKKFYVFDAIEFGSENEEGHATYYSYHNLVELLSEYNLEYVPYITLMDELFIKLLPNILTYSPYIPTFNFLLEPSGECKGEGIVIKNYDYKNPFGRSVWCKLINYEFYKQKDSKRKEQKPKVYKDYEKEIVLLRQLTDHLLSKQLNKLESKDNTRLGEYIKSCQAEFKEDFIDVYEINPFDMKYLNNKIAHRAKEYFMGNKYEKPELLEKLI